MMAILQYVALLAGLTLVVAIPYGFNLCWRGYKAYKDCKEQGKAWELSWRSFVLIVAELCRSIEAVCFFVFFAWADAVNNQLWQAVFIACIATQSIMAIPQKIIQLRGWWAGRNEEDA